MKLLTQKVRNALPAFYSGEETPAADKVCPVKFFDPCGSWTWYALEFDGEDTFYGYVDGFEREFGYFSASELQAVKGPLGIGIERDLHWTPKPLGDAFPELRVQAEA